MSCKYTVPVVMSCCCGRVEEQHQRGNQCYDFRSVLVGFRGVQGPVDLGSADRLRSNGFATGAQWTEARGQCLMAVAWIPRWSDSDQK
ncbi:hypothetical protein GDO81_027838 [Engystomops pustulosus]|uniref:Uncharacterized protein n=1 Tax=Engystomops pustulosus TaxID=76066 RepID=A0AAV6ZJW9_ENGPU|nr:hypothetical protein GDO81_027838 [Engystomops pustulosus]